MTSWTPSGESSRAMQSDGACHASEESDDTVESHSGSCLGSMIPALSVPAIVEGAFHAPRGMQPVSNWYIKTPSEKMTARRSMSGRYSYCYGAA